MASDDTPLMQQWREAKSRHRDSLLFFRVGDFYELFHGDADEGTRLLGLTLTSRNNGAAAKVPLAGIPAQAPEDHLARPGKMGRRAARGRVLVAEHPRPAAGQVETVRFEDRGRRKLRGISQRLRLFEVVWWE